MSDASVRIAVVPGDGIGPEVMRAALKVAQTVADCSGRNLRTTEFDLGAERYLREGVSCHQTR